MILKKDIRKLGCDNLKKITAIVLAAALILAALTVFSSPNVKANASEVKVLSYSWNVAPSNTILAQSPGDLVVVGEIQNLGSSIVQNVTLLGSAFSSSGQELATSQGQAFVYETAPGQKAPFSIDFASSSAITQNSDWISSVANITVTVLSVTDTATLPYSGLTISSESGSTYFISNGVFTVVGVVRNAGEETTGNVWVVTTFYNAAGTVVGFNFTDYLASSLAPSAMAPFTATPVDNTVQLSGEIANYSLVIDSEPLASSQSSSTTRSSSPTAPPSSIAQLLTTAIIVVVVVVVVVVLILIWKHQKLPPPPSPPPPPVDVLCLKINEGWTVY